MAFKKPSSVGQHVKTRKGKKRKKTPKIVSPMWMCTELNMCLRAPDAHSSLFLYLVGHT